MVYYEDIIALAKMLEGQTLRTSADFERFTVRIVRNQLEYTPEKTGKARLSATVEKVLRRYNLTESLHTSDYNKITANASYILRLIELKIAALIR